MLTLAARVKRPQLLSREQMQMLESAKTTFKLQLPNERALSDTMHSVLRNDAVEKKVRLKQNLMGVKADGTRRGALRGTRRRR